MTKYGDSLLWHVYSLIKSDAHSWKHFLKLDQHAVSLSICKNLTELATRNAMHVKRENGVNSS